MGPGYRSMLKIEPVETERGLVTLRLEGRVVGPWVEELRRSCEGVLARRARLVLDLAEVSFADLQGVALLRGLGDRNVGLVRCSLFVAEQLKASRRPCSPS